jgi:hypothetical protein
MRDFPSVATVERLRAYGVRSVVLHTDLAQNWPQEGAELRPVEGLPVSVSRRGPLVIYDVR